MDEARVKLSLESSRVFEHLVEQFYRPLYRFGLSLTGSESDAGDLVQQTFYLWAAKGHQLRDQAKARMWLFTTLHREFLNQNRRLVRFPHHDVAESEAELPPVEPGWGGQLDAERALAAMVELEENFRGPVALFFLEDYSYREIATALGIPLGTVKSRLSRGLHQLQERLRAGQPGGTPKPQTAAT